MTRRRRERSRWELQLTHHKLYLENNPPEVQHFEITHGYNLLTVNRAFATTHVTWVAFHFIFGAGFLF